MVAFTKKNLLKKVIAAIFQRENVGKCWLREFLESVQKEFKIDFDSNNNASIAFDRSFDSSLTTACLQNKNTSSGCLKKNYRTGLYGSK